MEIVFYLNLIFVCQIGTEDVPHMSKAVIEMYGHLRAVELPIFGAKTIGVREGTLDIHGNIRLSTDISHLMFIFLNTKVT